MGLRKRYNGQAPTYNLWDMLANGKWFTVITIIVMLNAACITQQPMVNATTSGDDWPMYQHDSNHTGFTTSSAPKAIPTVIWSTGEDPKGDFMPSSPIIYDGIVYVADNTLYAFNATTGDKIWKLNDQGINSPIVENGVIFTYKGAFNASTGAMLWKNEYSAMYFATVSEGIYYTCIAEANSNSEGNNYSVVALNASTGNLIWKSNNYYFRYSPAISEGSIYFGGEKGVIALDAYTGNKIWECELDSGVDYYLTATNGHVYVNAVNGALYSIDTSTGQKDWNSSINASSYSSPAVAYGNVYIGSTDGYVYALSAENGSRIWSYKIPNDNHPNSSPVIADGTIYVTTEDGYLYALNADTGDNLWSYFIGEQPQTGCSPAISNGYLYVGSKNNMLIALGSNATTTPFTPENLWMILISAVAVVVAIAAFFAIRHRKRKFTAQGQSLVVLRLPL